MMTHEKPIRDASADTAIIRGLSSITSEQVDMITQAVDTVGPEWGLQATHDYDGYLSILIAPNDSDQRKSFFVAGTAQRLKLFEAYNDKMTSLGNFTEIEALSDRLLDIISQK